MDNRLYKVNFFVKGEWEVAKWEAFQKWLLDELQCTPLDFAAANTVEKIAHMLYFFCVVDVKDKTAFNKQFKAACDSVASKILDYDAITYPNALEALFASRMAKNETQFTFFGKEIRAHGTQSLAAAGRDGTSTRCNDKRK